MKCRKLVLVFLLVLFGLSFSGSWASAQEVPYDLSGTWTLRQLSNEQSFCDGSFHQERVEVEMLIEQDEEQLQIIISPDEDPEYWFGRTSHFVIAAWEFDVNGITLWSGKVSKNGKTISGILTLVDTHECPDAEAGRGSFVATKISTD
jgi:hypothetical protein